MKTLIFFCLQIDGYTRNNSLLNDAVLIAEVAVLSVLTILLPV
jgi:hypothetical protein